MKVKNLLNWMKGKVEKWESGKVGVVAALFCALFLVVTPVFAQTPDIGLEYAGDIGLTTTDVRTTTSNIIRAFMGGLGLLAVGIIIYAGFVWMTAAGNPEKVKLAQRMLTYAAIGLVVIFSAYAIARFVFGALGVDVGGAPVGNCAPGQVCSSGGGGGFGGSTTGFRITGISPIGDSPSGNGWPKNFGITVSFSGPVSESSITATSFKVVECNSLAPLSPSRDFDEAQCDETKAVAGTFEFNGNKVTFRPQLPAGAAVGTEPMFDPNIWYRVFVKSSLVSGLICPPRPSADFDISSTGGPRDLCERAMVFADVIDTNAPTVSLSQPNFPPAYCAANIPVLADAQDDYLVASVDYLVDGGSDGLFDVTAQSPFTASILANLFADGLEHRVTAVAHDGVGKSSSVATTEFKVAAPHCCNAVVDAVNNETGLNCGVNSGCGACSGNTCTTNSQCQSGFCDPASGVCVERPIIDSMTPNFGGVGTLVTLKGRFFGSTPGTIVFVGDPANAADDVTTVPCAQGAWSSTQVTFAVPNGAVGGAIRLVAASGQSALSPAFMVGGPLKPGICLLEPFSGPAGSGLVIRGVGFGNNKGQSVALLGDEVLSIGQGGWSDAVITTIVPSVSSGEYPVSVSVQTPLGPSDSNEVVYNLTPSAEETRPQISGIFPAAGSVGSSFTIEGNGFGKSTGVVRLFFGDGREQEIAIADQPSCSKFWHDTYVVVKVPDKYQSGNKINSSGGGELHKVELETANGFKTARVDFRVDKSPLKPTICAIEPNNGPAGQSVTITGEGFGSGPGSSAAGSDFVVEFFKNQTTREPATVYGQWKPIEISSAVPGDIKIRSTWPTTGPVRLTANGQLSGNSVPFTVQNCTEAGASCPTGTSCCASGACSESCEAPARIGGYGWQLSTEVLPSIPRVVERAICDKDLRLLQSPSPFKGSTNACANAALVVEFTRKMQNKFDGSTVKVVECGTGEEADCAGGFSVALGSFLTADSDHSTVLTVGPSSGAWEDQKWYQVTLVSDVLGQKGLQDVAGKFLDGDRDGTEGGDYVWNFRARVGGSACAIDHVTVTPGETTINEQGGSRSSAAEFISMLTSGNCNVLQCNASFNYDISWLVRENGGDFIELLPSETANNCPGGLQPVLGIKETELGRPAPLAAVVTEAGRSVASGLSDVTVKFADPAVVAHGPDCDLACVNSDVYALFNVPMEAASFAPERGNVELMKCRNAACNAPFDPQAISVVEVPDVNDPLVTRGLSLSRVDVAGNTVNLEPDTDYLVRIKGGDENGVLSASGVPLKHLTDGTYFTWQFRTKNTSAPCLVSKSVVSPKQLTMNYIGERGEFRVLPFGAPDQCDSRGQALRAESYNWVWESIDGFVSGFIDPVQYPFIGEDTRLDTDPVGLAGCTDRCLSAGSQNVLPQCGNGVKEKGEDCDGGNNCSERCLLTGSLAPTCGNGVIDLAAGETCDPGSGANSIPGCLIPAAGVKGCVLLGSSSANGVCGDRRVTDGESCDDGNKFNGDGCSANCLNEGTLPTCLGAAAGTACINFCGNGLQEPGEDVGCDDGVTSPLKAGCDVSTCLFKGTPSCGNGLVADCCGNQRVDAGENPLCDLSGGLAEGCSNSCLLKGSSSNYSSPSFCRDGEVGLGEAVQCDAGTITPDGVIDPRQVIEAGAPTDEETVTIISAGLPEITRDENVGKATVNLSCTCNEQADPEAFCSAIGAAKSLSLGCANSGCCAIAPTVLETTPTGGDRDQCLNVAISVVFSDPVDAASVEQGVMLGEEIAVGATCADGREALPNLAYVQSEPGFFGKIWRAIAGFFKSLIGQPVAAQVAPNTPFCRVPGVFVVNGTVARFISEQALNKDKAYRIYVNSAVVKGANSVPLAEDYNSIFFAGDELCRIGAVTIEPVSHLFTVAEDLGTGNAADANDGDQAFTATARSEGHGGVVIESKTAYQFNWQWDKTIEAPLELASPVVVTPVELANGRGHDAVATVSVRRGVEGFPKNGSAGVLVRAIIPAQNGEAASSVVASAQAVVMLCAHPWPERRVCSDAHTPLPALPWDTSARCSVPGTSVWYPFYDKVSNVEFYYCRDTQQSGDVVKTLPALREDVVRIQPGRDILFEYLFTFDNASTGPWSRDAIGLRVAKNLSHLPIDAWYRGQGFGGAPSASTVDGQPALLEGRTVYVGAVTRSGDGIYTNVNVLSHSDQAAPETVGVFGQLMENIDFTRNLRDFGYCINSFGEQLTDSRDEPVTCAADRDCAIGTDGNPDPARLGNSCLVLESKLVRDVRRWQDLQTLRSRISNLGLGAFPKLDAGTYLRSQTTSRWPSWTETLGDELGASMPNDPLNVFSLCPEGADPTTCFNEAEVLYQCPAGSHVYEYQSILNGTDFRLRNDFETSCVGITVPEACDAVAGVGPNGEAQPFCQWTGDVSTGSCQALASWGGNTCLEVTREAGSLAEQEDVCLNTAGCAWDGRLCNYAVGKLEIGGINAAPVCADERIGESGICGDGIIQSGEQCEPIGDIEVSSCDLAGGIGSHTRICKNDCQFSDFTPCKVAECGDGLTQGGEVCDDGELNGTYGFCNGSCNGQGNRCGDGIRQPQEKCDCGADNGSYIKNGILDPAQSCSISGTAPASCDFSCSAAAPHCGDGVVNGPEQCDGGFQESVGYCAPTGVESGATGAPCNTSADCPSGNSCLTCPTPEQKMHRSCRSTADAVGKFANAACTFNTWRCTAAGTCGDGVKNTGEQCDDGNTNNSDSCVIDVAGQYQCKTATCGDGYINPSAGEQCDDGAQNGVACLPGYGQNCQYCTTACKAVTASGGFCGDNKLQSAGAAFCSISGKVCDVTPPPPVCNPNAFGGQTCTQTTLNCSAADGVCQAQSGPEQCEGTVGLLASYECVSNEPEDRSMGVKSASQCLVASCNQGCSGQAQLCFNDLSVNSPNFDLDGLSDACDPDRDNDGVPLDLDCNDFNQNIHGGYVIHDRDINGNVLPATLVNIAAKPDICGDGIDNDCDGLVDNVALVTGAVKNNSTNQLIGGALVRAFCAGVEVGRATTNSTVGDANFGKYTINAVSTGCTSFDLYASSDNQQTPFCFNEYMKVSAGVNACVPGTPGSTPPPTTPAVAADLYLMPRPPVGAVKVDLQWNTEAVDLKLCSVTNEFGVPSNCTTTELPTIKLSAGGKGRRTMVNSTVVAPGANGLPSLMKIFTKAFGSDNSKGIGLTMRVWKQTNTDACAVTTIVADEATPLNPTSTTAVFWAALQLNTAGVVTPINAFSTTNVPPPQ